MAKREANQKALREDLAQKKEEFESLGWAITQDGESAEWEARHTDGRAVGTFVKLEELFEEMQKTEQLLEEAQKIETEGLEEPSFSVEESAQIDKFIEKGWEFTCGYGLWCAEKEINGKKVRCVDHAGLSALFAQMEPFDKADNSNEEANYLEEFFPKTTIESCRVELTEAEKLMRYQSYSNKQKEIGQEELKFGAQKEQHKANLKTLGKEANKFLAAAETGFEWRELECTQEYNFQKGVITVRRPDTNEIVSTRSMTKEEILKGTQKPLFENA